MSNSEARKEAAVEAGRRLAELNPLLADEDITTPERRLHAGDMPDLEGALKVIFGPIRPLLPDAQKFLDKKLGESTGAEFMAFVICVGYAVAVGYFGAQVAAGILRAGIPRASAVRVPLALR